MRSVLLASMSMIALLSACNSTDTGPGTNEVGTYNLVSVNGLPVPAVTQNDATIKTEVLSGTFVINSNDTFTETRQGRITLSGSTPSPVTSTSSGTWSISGTQISFVAGTVQNPVNFTGTYVAGSLTYSAGGATFVYQEQGY